MLKVPQAAAWILAQGGAPGGSAPVAGDRDRGAVGETEAGDVDRAAGGMLGNLRAGLVVARPAGIAGGDLERLEAPGEAGLGRPGHPGAERPGGAAAEDRRRHQRDAGDRGDLDRVEDAAAVGAGDRGQRLSGDRGIVADGSGRVCGGSRPRTVGGGSGQGGESDEERGGGGAQPAHSLSMLRPKSGSAVSWPASMMPRRIARVRVK